MQIFYFTIADETSAEFSVLLEHALCKLINNKQLDINKNGSLLSNKIVNEI